MLENKQIIIDGCDVSGCEFRFRTYGCDCMSSNRETKVLTESSRCADNPNCYYKQLKRAEQRIVELNKTIKAKEQECEELKEELEAVYDDCKGCSTCNEALYNANLYAKEYRKFSKTLTEIKEIAKPYQRDIDKICGYCRKYDSCHACCIDDLKYYEYRTGTTKACERFVELERFDINIVANRILQKISECEANQ